jgi:hypothetical protein
MPHSFRSRAEGALGVRQLAAAFTTHLHGIEWINRAFKEGASKLAHSKGFTSGKNYAALGILPAFLAAGTKTLPWNRQRPSSIIDGSADCANRPVARLFHLEIQAQRTYSANHRSLLVASSEDICS